MPLGRGEAATAWNSGGSTGDSWPRPVSAAHSTADPSLRRTSVRSWPVSDRRLDARSEVSANGRSQTQSRNSRCCALWQLGEGNRSSGTQGLSRRKQRPRFGGLAPVRPAHCARERATAPPRSPKLRQAESPQEPTHAKPRRLPATSPSRPRCSSPVASSSPPRMSTRRSDGPASMHMWPTCRRGASTRASPRPPRTGLPSGR